MWSSTKFMLKSQTIKLCFKKRGGFSYGSRIYDLLLGHMQHEGWTACQVLVSIEADLWPGQNGFPFQALGSLVGEFLLGVDMTPQQLAKTEDEPSTHPEKTLRWPTQYFITLLSVD